MPSEIVGLFRDAGQAHLAVNALARKGLLVANPDDLLEDADGVHVRVRPGEREEDARVLLLRYGAYDVRQAVS